jgi:hypothetical protein
MISVVNKYKHTPTPNDTYIGRGSPFGNPYSHLPSTYVCFRVDSRNEAVEKYKGWFESSLCDRSFMEKLNELAKKSISEDINLVCFCAPLRCHGDIVKAKIEELARELT